MCCEVWPVGGARASPKLLMWCDFVAIGLEIVYAKFQENWTKFEGGDRFWSIWIKSKMAEINIWRLWRHRMRWNRADCLISMVPVIQKWVAWVRSYAGKCAVKFDLLVALELCHSCWSDDMKWNWLRSRCSYEVWFRYIQLLLRYGVINILGAELPCLAAILQRTKVLIQN